MPTPTTLQTAPHRLAVTVYGSPAPQGSKRHVGHGILVDHNPESLHTWREDVKLAALRAMDETPEWQRDYPAIVAHLTFTLARPASHYRTGRYASLLKENAPHLHATRPDLDKLLRSTWDALTSAGAYRDDSRIAQVFAVKAYASAGVPGVLDKPGARIVLSGVGS